MLEMLNPYWGNKMYPLSLAIVFGEINVLGMVEILTRRTERVCGCGRLALSEGEDEHRPWAPSSAGDTDFAAFGEPLGIFFGWRLALVSR